MSRRKHDPLSGSWSEAISALSGRPVAAVTDFLDRHDIREQATIPRPVGLMVRRIAFGGVKQTAAGATPFDFEWSGLGPGLWLVGSAGNSCGKTSLLGIMRWLLRGAPPRSIPPDVLPWIRRAEVDFDLGGVPHRVSLDLGGGYAASLSEVRPGASAVERLKAASPEAFADGMSDFMMRALDLSPILGTRRDPDPAKDGQVTRHRWPALFAAFHIGTDYSALLGDVAQDGLPNRMLNMFAGFPHAAAVASIAHVRKALEITEQQVDLSKDAVSAHAATTVARLRAELAGLTSGTLGETVADLLAEVHRASEEAAAVYARLPGLSQRVVDLAEVAAAARRQHNADRVALRNFTEAGAAASVFRALEPKCCPRCDRTFGAERKAREQEALACMVCGDEAPQAEAEDPDEVKARLEEAVRLSERIRADADGAERDGRREVEAAEASLERLKGRLADAQAKQARARQDEAGHARRAVLEAMIAEVERDIAATGDRPKTDDAAIADACDAVFRARLGAEQEAVLKDVGAEVLALLRALGVPNLDGVRLTTHPQLKLVKGGFPVSYSDLSIGEQLRCKVALLLALMKVAQRRGIGRHPGILFIDTPGAQELAEGDLRAMAAGLASLCGDLPSLQVFVATKRVAEFEGAVPAGQRRIAAPGGTVW